MSKLLADPLADWESWHAKNGFDFESSNSNPPSVIAPYADDVTKVAQACFDRDSGIPVPASMLKPSRQALQTYHRSPEAKFLNAGYLDKGFVRRRHVKAANIVNIGKEAHRWEEQSMLGINPEPELNYGDGSGNRDDRIADKTGDFQVRANGDGEGSRPNSPIPSFDRQRGRQPLPPMY